MFTDSYAWIKFKEGLDSAFEKSSNEFSFSDFVGNFNLTGDMDWGDVSFETALKNYLNNLVSSGDLKLDVTIYKKI